MHTYTCIYVCICMCCRSENIFALNPCYFRGKKKIVNSFGGTNIGRKLRLLKKCQLCQHSCRIYNFIP